MATSAGELIYTVDVDTARMITDTKRAEKQIVSLENKMNSAAATSGKLSTALTKVGVAVAAAISVQQLAALQKLSEGFNLLRSRVTRLSEDAATAAQNFDNLVAIANKTGSSVADTVKLWEGLTATLKEFGATSGDVQTLVETLQKIGVVGGSSAEEMSNALRQLGQAISGGTLRAEEFNSIIEQMPELGRQIAAGLGIPFSELRAQMLAGELTSKKVLDAIYSQVDTVNKEFAKMPRTVAQASNALVNSFGDAISRVDKEIGASQNIAKFLDILAKGVEATFSKQLQDRQRFNDLLVERQKLQESINQVERNSPTSTKQLDLMRQRLASINKELRDMQDAEKKRTIDASKGQEKKDRPDYTKNIKVTSKADKAAESAAKKAAKAREQNTDAIADAKLKTEQLRLELENLKSGTDDVSASTSRYSIESAKLAAQQQLNKQASKEQVDELAKEILAQRQVTEEISKQAKLKAKKKEAKTFLKGVEVDAASPMAKVELEQKNALAKAQEYYDLGLIQESEYQKARTQIMKVAADERTAIELARNSMILTASSDFFGGMADLTGAFAGEQSGAYKALFAISKGFAIANAALQLQTAIANASALPWPANFPAIAQAVALGGQIASGIAGVNYGGAREFGGPVDADKMYRVGEGGRPEVYQDSAGKNYMIPGDGGKVIPNDKIGSGGGFQQNVNIHNYGNENVQTQTSMDGKQLDVIIGEVAKQISQRRGGVGRALASSTATKWKAQ